MSIKNLDLYIAVMARDAVTAEEFVRLAYVNRMKDKNLLDNAE